MTPKGEAILPAELDVKLQLMSAEEKILNFSVNAHPEGGKHGTRLLTTNLGYERRLQAVGREPSAGRNAMARTVGAQRAVRGAARQRNRGCILDDGR